MLPELCLNVTEMVLRIIQGGKKDQGAFSKCLKTTKFRSDLGVGHFPDGYYRPCEKLHIEQRSVANDNSSDDNTIQNPLII